MENSDISQWRIDQGVFIRRGWDGKDVAFRWCVGGCQRIFQVSRLKDGYCSECDSMRQQEQVVS